MRVSTAVVATENASSYLRKLCQHWSHKFTVSFDDRHGVIELPSAKCVLDAEEKALNVRLELSEAADKGRVEQVLEDHIRRFGFRETLVFAWTAGVA